MPIIVMQRISPKTAWVNAIHNPPVSSHIIFIRMYRQPEALVWTWVSLPKGHIAREAILSVCKPNGIPTIVIISIILPIKYSMAIMIPPNISQKKFPRIFMASMFLIQE
jgi:hypothetical protein